MQRNLFVAPSLSNIFLGASASAEKGYARALSAEAQPQPDDDMVSIIARESQFLPGKTLLACEFVSTADRRALDVYEKSKEQ